MFNIHKMLPMLGFEPWTSVIRSDCSTNWATTTAHINYIYHIDEVYCKIWIFPHVWTARLRLGCDALSWTVWPDLAIYWTLDNFLKPLTTTILPKPPTFLGNFCKGVKIYYYYSIILKNILQICHRPAWLHTKVLQPIRTYSWPSDAHPQCSYFKAFQPTTSSYSSLWTLKANRVQFYSKERKEKDPFAISFVQIDRFFEVEENGLENHEPFHHPTLTQQHNSLPLSLSLSLSHCITPSHHHTPLRSIFSCLTCFLKIAKNCFPHFMSFTFFLLPLNLPIANFYFLYYLFLSSRYIVFYSLFVIASILCHSVLYIPLFYFL